MTQVKLVGLSLTALAGVAGELSGTWALHLAFGGMLVSGVIIDFWAQSRGRGLDRRAASALCRRLSRTVYLLLYTVIAADHIVRAASNIPPSQPPKYLQDYFAFGLLALLTIRVLAAFSVRRLPAPRKNPRLESVEDGAALH